MMVVTWCHSPFDHATSSDNMYIDAIQRKDCMRHCVNNFFVSTTWLEDLCLTKCDKSGSKRVHLCITHKWLWKKLNRWHQIAWEAWHAIPQLELLVATSQQYCGHCWKLQAKSSIQVHALDVGEWVVDLLKSNRPAPPHLQVVTLALPHSTSIFPNRWNILSACPSWTQIS